MTTLRPDFMQMNTMLAAQFTEPGGPEVIRVVEVPRPEPGPGQVLIKAHASGVGMPDVLIRTGNYPWAPPLPATLGIEMSGTIVGLGSGVSGVRIGQPVFVSARDLPVRGGCYAEYLAADLAAAKPLPDDVDLDEAACLSNYQVAYHLVHTASRSVEARSVLVYGAAGGVGAAIVQLARLKRLRVIGLVGSPEKSAFAKAQGADETINYRTEDITTRVLEFTGGEGVDLILDSVGGPEFGRNFKMLAPMGLVVSYGVLSGFPDPDILTPMRAHFASSPAVRLFTMHTFDRMPQVRNRTMSALLDLFATRQIRPPIFRCLPLTQARQAHELFESGSVLGKLLLKPGP
jgi:NADPH:quinone reductase